MQVLAGYSSLLRQRKLHRSAKGDEKGKGSIWLSVHRPAANIGRLRENKPSGEKPSLASDVKRRPFKPSYYEDKDKVPFLPTPLALFLTIKRPVSCKY